MGKTLSFASDLGIKVLILSIALSLLPKSPFDSYIALTENIPYLQYLNWFIPMAEIILMLQSWLLALSIYYSILFISRFSNLVKG